MSLQFGKQLFLPFLSGPNACDENSYQLFSFFQSLLQQRRIPEQRNPLNKLQPASGFPKLFEAYPHFVNKIPSGLSRLSFRMIGIRGSTGPQKLTSNMIARSGVRELLDQPNHSHGVFQQALFQVKLLSQFPPSFSPCNVHYFLFSLFGILFVQRSTFDVQCSLFSIFDVLSLFSLPYSVCSAFDVQSSMFDVLYF
jgi:hypothetical protein